MTEFAECGDCGGYCCVVPREIACNYVDRLYIARELGMSVGEVTQRFTVRGKFATARSFKFTQPCIFWTTGRCGIYENRPGSCQEYEPRGNHNDCSEIMLDSIRRGTAPLIYIPA